MDRDLALKLVEEVKKMRNDLDAMKAYQKTMAEELQTIATNTTPADSAETTPADGAGET